MELIRKINQRGDTIVEVLLSILVVGAVLGGSYVAANRYFRNVRQAQEYSNALKIAEGQLEQVKSYIDNGINDPKTTTLTSFCISNGVKNSSLTDCKFQNLYNAKITRSGDATNGYVFDVAVTWPSLTSSSNSSVQLTYRVYD